MLVYSDACRCVYKNSICQGSDDMHLAVEFCQCLTLVRSPLVRGKPDFWLQSPAKVNFFTFLLFSLTVTFWKMCERPTEAMYCIGGCELELHRLRAHDG